jgi:N utilization substance protein B
MLSRRSVRVKAMQILYALNRDSDLKKSDAKKIYAHSIDQSFELLLFNIHLLYHLCKTSVEDFDKRKNKYLPTDFDKKFKPVLFENPLVKSLGTNRKLNQLFNEYAFNKKYDLDVLKNVYYEYAKEEGYLKFIQGEINQENTTEVLLDVWRFIKKYPNFEEILEDNYSNWIDDESVIVGAMKKIIKSLPTKDESFFMEHFPEDETIKHYGEALLLKTIEKDEELEAIIKPFLENWDMERVAVIDMILLKLAISEFLYFETIPVKVTMNEYVDLSKDYSTDKSREFINGVLDNVSKSLAQKNEIKKSGRGLID